MRLRPEIVAALLALTLAGCATYVPYPLHVYDDKQYADDLAFCQKAGANYPAQLNAGDIAVGAGKGATDNAVGAAVNPIVPVIGAAGGAGSALITGLDVLGRASANVTRHCLDEKTRRDQSAILANPDD